MGRLVTFWGNSDGAKRPRYIISRVAPHMKVSAKPITRPERALRRAKLKVISQAFRRQPDPCTECRGMPRRDMGWYIKDFQVFERI